MAEVKEPKALIEDAVLGIISLQKDIDQLQDELAKNEQFRTFLAKQKEATAQISDTWEQIESSMIKHNIKNLKGDWGWLTIAERQSFTIDEEALPRSYKKLVPDTKKIGNHFLLTGKPVKGTTPKTTKYLTKGIK